ncbi:DNA ligase, partial [candidate division WWE3 bacterium]|nr:DNA ligase [candidate division WWE3 bacterium]
LQKIIKKGGCLKVDEQKSISSSEEVLKMFKGARDQGLEGLVLKRLDSTYDAGGRGYTWVKFKREEVTGDLTDTIDGVLLGYYHGRGNRAQFGIGGFLVGVYDKEKDEYFTVTKVGSGPSEEEWQEIKARVDKIRLKEVPKNVEINKNLLPDVIARPQIVVGIRADEITVSESPTARYALRFPRLMQFRDDKRPEDTTTVVEIEQLYKLQSKK